jgi:hypothetical protein
MDKTPEEIRRYMQDNITDHIDPLTGEVNDTGLAEDALWFFLCPGEGEILNSLVDLAFDLAHEVAAKYEQDTL